MSKETKIEWADSTVNFWSGCAKVSDGCKNCYAEALSDRKLGNIGGWGKGAPRKRHQSAFNLALRLNRVPCVCGGCGNADSVVKLDCHCSACNKSTNHHRRRVFSLSLGDWLDPEVPIEWLAEMLDTIRQCDQLEWLLVTKRPELWKSRLEQVVIREDISTELFQFVRLWLFFSKAPKHVMVLTSVENQKAADERIPALLEIPAAKRGLSCEPLLGPVDLFKTFRIHEARAEQIAMAIDWVIIGGESGPGARVCNVDWIRSLKDQCQAAGMPVFVKQLGANVISTAEEAWPHKVYLTDKKGGDMAEWPEALRVREFPKV